MIQVLNAGVWKKRAGKIRPSLFLQVFPLLGIIVEALSGLASEKACAYHFPKQRMWTVFAVAELVVQNFHDCKAYVESNEVSQSQRAHDFKDGADPDLYWKWNGYWFESSAPQE